MITITKKEEVVLNQVEIFNPEYPDGVPIKFLKFIKKLSCSI